MNIRLEHRYIVWVYKDDLALLDHKRFQIDHFQKLTAHRFFLFTLLFYNSLLHYHPTTKAEFHGQQIKGIYRSQSKYISCFEKATIVVGTGSFNFAV
jgi:hypothetical protein